MVNFYLLFIVTSVIISASYGEPNKDVIRLGFEGVRGSEPTKTPHITLIDYGKGHKLPKNMFVFCSNVSYPNDIFCDVTMLKNHEKWQEKSEINSVEMEYMHQGPKRTKCIVSLDSLGSESSSFEFQEANCKPQVKGGILPRFGVDELTWLRLYFNDYPQCTAFLKHSMNKGRFVKDWTVRNNLIAFELRFVLCEDAEPHDDTDELADLRYDGRRYRPDDAVSKETESEMIKRPKPKSFFPR